MGGKGFLFFRENRHLRFVGSSYPRVEEKYIAYEGSFSVSFSGSWTFNILEDLLF